MSSLWAVTAFFNPAGFSSRLRNYRTFRRHLGVPLVAVELSFTGRFELDPDDADILVRITGSDVMWQKERLLNLGLAALPADCDKVIWLDCDIVFGRDDWAAAVSEALDRHLLLQPFSHARFMPPGWRPGDNAAAVDLRHPPAFLVARGSRPEAAAAFTEGSVVQMAYTPGLAWAARRELLDGRGVYDACVIGGGDGALMRAAFGLADLTGRLQRMSPARYEHYRAWAEPFRAALRGTEVGFVPGDVHHLWHGAIADRRYVDRHAAFSPFGFDPATDITIDPGGAWRWSSPKTAMHAFVADYFAGRREDD
ncbi:MAG: hypothetical protein KDK07_23030 [Bauldia sp.]|nr:hypothetical protein [Bauldia sp.]